MKAWDEAAIPPPGWVLEPNKIRAAWGALIRDLSAAGLDRPVLIVTSNGIARFVLDHVTDFETEPDSIKLKTGAYGLIRADAEQVTLVNWNLRP